MFVLLAESSRLELKWVSINSVRKRSRKVPHLLSTGFRSPISILSAFMRDFELYRIGFWNWQVLRLVLAHRFERKVCGTTACNSTKHWWWSFSSVASLHRRPPQKAFDSHGFFLSLCWLRRMLHRGSPKAQDTLSRSLLGRQHDSIFSTCRTWWVSTLHQRFRRGIRDGWAWLE